jgi:hypothetical protein
MAFSQFWLLCYVVINWNRVQTQILLDYYDIILVITDRLKNANDVVDAFNVDPLYLKHDRQGQAPDYRVEIILNCIQ